MTTTGSRPRRRSSQHDPRPGTRPTRTPTGGVLVGVDTSADPGTRADEVIAAVQAHHGLR